MSRPLFALFLLSASLLAGCASPGGGDDDKLTPNTVLGKGGGDNNFFEPTELSVAVGSTVTWRGHSGDHTVTFESDVREGENPPDSGNLAVDEEFRVAFPSPGIYAYRCIYHSFGFGAGEGMTGSVTVN